ncbi:MAG: hypothetical protein KGJ70_00300 [Gemmatimonadota bacterium]|nr:hypothetical protein [Gemmatimonadota bacterium]
MTTQQTQHTTVNQTTHGLRRRRASETAPSTGMTAMTRSAASALAAPYIMLDAPRSLTSRAEKYSVATFIEKVAFAKSYEAQLQRSSAEARSGTRSTDGTAAPVSADDTRAS